MFAAASTRTNLSQQCKLACVAALLTLSLAVGSAAITQPVGAMAPQVGQASAQTADTTVVDTGGTVATKPKGGNSATKKATEKTHTVCIQFSVEEWDVMFGEKTDAGGMVCHKE